MLYFAGDTTAGSFVVINTQVFRLPKKARHPGVLLKAKMRNKIANVNVTERAHEWLHSSLRPFQEPTSQTHLDAHPLIMSIFRTLEICL